MRNLEQQIQEVFEGVADEATEQAVASAMRESDEARELYVKHARLHAELDHRAAGHEALCAPKPIIPFSELKAAHNKRVRKWVIGVSAAAAVALIFILQQAVMPPSVHTLAVESSPGSVYQVSSPSETEDGSLVEGSEIHLSEGVLKLTLTSGVEAVVEAPAQFTYQDVSTLYLHYGSAWCLVPEDVTGFTIKSPDMHVVDLGTEFAVFSTPDKADECYVYDGRVRITARYGEKATRELGARMGIEASGLGRLNEIDFEQRKFISSLPDGPLHLHWSFDSEQNNYYKAESNFVSIDDIELRFIPDSRESNGQVVGKLGKALEFGQSGDFAYSNWAGISGDKKRTLACWIKMPAGEQMQANQSLMGWGRRKHLENAQSCFLLFSRYSADSKYSFNLSLGEAQVITQKTVAAGEWAHVTVTFDPEATQPFAFYIDGESVEVTLEGYQGVNTLIDDALSRSFIIGDSLTLDTPSNRDIPVGTVIDELHIIHDALTEEQVRALMSASNR